MSESLEVLRYTAFTEDKDGGSPASTVLTAEGLSDDEMKRIAQRSDTSGTAFLTSVPVGGDVEKALKSRKFTIRYFSADRELDFCGQSTIVASVAISDRIGPGKLNFKTNSGTVRVHVIEGKTDLLTATFTTVDPKIEPATVRAVEAVMTAIGWSPDDLDPQLPRRIAYAGMRHLVLGATSRERLEDVTVKATQLVDALNGSELASVALIWSHGNDDILLRNFVPDASAPEDLASGSAAAAVGAYLREIDRVEETDTVTVHQGSPVEYSNMIKIAFSDDDDRVRVTGTAVSLD